METERILQVFVSLAAAEQIKLQLQKRGTPDAYIRLGVRGSGCNGYSYVIQFEETTKEKDKVFNEHGVNIIIDPKSLLFLNGSTLDWEKTLIKQGYKVKNPNEKSKCGCGHSFSV
jgi:iron-sulfur cluster assembly protein